ncbi:MAG TPA: transglycosylase family protein [Solirubrobacteraceae bacterium]|nr:transglycosylase family protein [Solirubrobacteraceae bacterium]
MPHDGDATRELAYRRSLRAARVRRATARLRRRRLSRGRRSMLVATVGILLACGGAVAQKSVSIGTGLSADTIRAAQRALGVAADGVVGPRTRAATKRFQRRKGLTVDGVIGPQTLEALGVEELAVRGARLRGRLAASDSVLQRIAACESGGDPTAVSADGQYRGKYQFSLQTWHDIGGTGDPAQASEAQQDRLAARLLRRAGTSPWPNCA